MSRGPQPMPKPHTSSPDTTVLETRVPLSSSIIWEAQREFYRGRGIKAWTEDRVPEFITNNPFIADAYARMVFAFFQDCGDSSGSSLRILELGAGTGKFAYLFLRRFSDLLNGYNVPQGNFRYRMTDCSESLVDWWRENRYLQEFVATGILEFECLRADGKPPLDEVAPSPGPLVVIGNYVFDSLPQDMFLLRGGKLSEVVVSTSRQETGNAAISELKRSYEAVAVTAERYPDASWNEILRRYQSRPADAGIFFPTGALAAARDLANISDGRMLLLVGDKGCTREAAFAPAAGEPAYEFHAPNCFSQMVNFDAVAKYFESTGGSALLPEKSSAAFSICAFLRGRLDDCFPATTKSYTDLQAAFGVDDLFALMSWLNPHIEEMSVAQTLAVLRLSHWDTLTFLRVFPVLVRKASSASGEREDVHAMIAKVWANYFPVSAVDSTLAFYCGMVLMEFRFHDEALAFFEISLRDLGPSAATSYNMGRCHEGAGRPTQALERMKEACDIDPTFEPARLAINKLAEKKREAGQGQR